jgi:hypothetical protein
VRLICWAELFDGVLAIATAPQVNRLRTVVHATVTVANDIASLFVVDRYSCVARVSVSSRISNRLVAVVLSVIATAGNHGVLIVVDRNTSVLSKGGSASQRNQSE